MNSDKKIDELFEVVTFIKDHMVSEFSEVRGELAEVKGNLIEVKNRLFAVEGKLDGVNSHIDNEADKRKTLEVRVSKVEQKVGI